MSDQLDELHAQAVLGLLAAGLPAQVAVYDGKVPDPMPDPAGHPWVLVYTQIQRPRDGVGNALDGRSATIVARFWCHNVGATAAAARAVSMQVRSALLDARPSVAGRTCSLIRWYDGQPPSRDETLGSLVMDQVDIYEFFST